MTKNVLIVDDQTGIRLLLEEVIRGEGYQVTSCEDGISAINYVKEHQPDLMIIDLQIPLRSGSEVVAILEESGYQIPTIFISGLIENAKALTNNYQTVKGYISKPFNLIDVKEKINQLMNE